MTQETKQAITSMDEYNKYLKVIKPRVWLVIGALLLMVAMTVLWAFTGNILTTQTCKSVVSGDIVIGYVGMDGAGAVQPGQSVNVAAGELVVGGVVESVGNLPVSREEAAQSLGSQALAEGIVPPDGGVEVVARLSRSTAATPNTVVSMEIVTQDIAPIQLLMGKK